MALSKQRMVVITILEQIKLNEETFPTLDELSNLVRNHLETYDPDTTFSKEDIPICFEDSTFREAAVQISNLTTRDFSKYRPTIRTPPENLKNYLSPEQLLTIKVLLSTADGRSFRTKLRQLGVSELTFKRWMGEKAFRSLLSNQALAGFEENIGLVDHALVNNAVSGDLRSIQYLNELTGRYRPQQPGNQLDPIRLVAQVLEVIQQEVSDPDTLNRIGQRLLGLTESVHNRIASTPAPVGALNQPRTFSPNISRPVKPANLSLG